MFCEKEKISGNLGMSHHHAVLFQKGNKLIYKYYKLVSFLIPKFTQKKKNFFFFFASSPPQFLIIILKIHHFVIISIEFTIVKLGLVMFCSFFTLFWFEFWWSIR